jgi:hypothetical protein
MHVRNRALAGLLIAGILVGLIGGLAWALVGTGASATSDHQPTYAAVEATKQAGATPPAPIPTFPVTPTPPPPPPLALSGSGSQTTQPLALPRAMTIVTMHHTSPGRFKVTLVLPSGKPYGQLASGQDGWIGSRAIIVPEAGNYTFNVEAGGDWTIDVTFPTPEVAPVSDLPFEQSGSGSQAVYFINVPMGDHTLTARYDGEGPFTVAIMDSTGNIWQRLAESDGPTQTSSQFTIKTQPTWLVIDVRAQGDWTVGVE